MSSKDEIIFKELKSEHSKHSKPSKRSSKKHLSKGARNGKKISHGTREKHAFLKVSLKRNQQLNLMGPRETVVEKVLNRDKMQSIALPPQLQKEKIRVVRRKHKKKV